jgi:hypothetical protein
VTVHTNRKGYLRLGEFAFGYSRRRHDQTGDEGQFKVVIVVPPHRFIYAMEPICRGHVPQMPAPSTLTGAGSAKSASAPRGALSGSRPRIVRPIYRACNCLAAQLASLPPSIEVCIASAQPLAKASRAGKPFGLLAVDAVGASNLVKTNVRR